MKFNDITVRSGFPRELDIVVEIPFNSESVKYEIDGDLLRVDRFLSVSMRYPCNYGFIPNTLGGDGDPLDALVITRFPVAPTSVICSKVIGVLLMEDEKGRDEKVLTVPVKSVDSFYASVDSYTDLPEAQVSQIEHFFCRYKDLDQDKFVKILGWMDKKYAIDLILRSRSSAS